MQQIKTVRNSLPILASIVLGVGLCFALGVGLASAGDAVAPDVSELRGVEKVLLVFDGEEFIAKSVGAENERATRLPPSEGLDTWKLALIARTAKAGGINGFSLVTWKPVDTKPEREWPQLKEIEGATARISGAQAFVLRRLEPAEPEAKWSFEIISFRRMEPEEKVDDANAQEKKEILEEAGVRFIENGRFTLAAPSAPDERTFLGVLLAPVWKESGKTIDGFDARLVSTPAPTPAGGA